MASLRLIVVFGIAMVLTIATAEEKYTVERHTDVKNTCAKLLRTPTEDLEHYLASEYPEKHDTFCFVRCLYIIYGIYDDEHGVDLGKAFEMFGKGLSLDEFTEQSKVCFDHKEGEEEVSCHCKKAALPLLCLRNWYLENNRV
ncbi:general odorant-binding protein 99b-like [Ochlerotatus camptorhynchus]|uniref:general odorant-binding protein 99b-like n=1 Tax=Ochlerotatus camptorhynchus TaxID=644619 RepID=UPI0031E47060